MKTILEQMVEKYNPKNNEEKKHVIKEVLQEMVLCGLSKAGFFEEAAFYGGTALRIFYGLDRFSEDLDFSLLEKNENFDLSKYFPVLEMIMQSFGIQVELEMKNKTVDSNIQSAFLKGDTVEQFLIFYPNELIKGIHKDEKVKVKFEVDINPPDGATFDTKFMLLPSPYVIRVYDESSLFAGKIHAIICRTWKARVKGRDLYDFIFYLSRRTKLNLQHLKAKLIDSNFIAPNDSLTCEDVKKILISRYEEIDFQLAKEDVIPFIKDSSLLNIWSKEFFISITDQIEV